jgi:AcrR family transcriptional regulator
MNTTTDNRHASRSAQTRARFIEVAERLFAQRSVESVSVNEITVAAGQKNRNALQYHFGNRDGLLQAIIDKHSQHIHGLRKHYMDSADFGALPDSRASARALVMPIAQHIEEDPSGIHYVKILSQLAALNNEAVNPAARSHLSFLDEKRLAMVMARATAHLGPEEARRRLFLVVSITFHSLADICRAAERTDVTADLKDSRLLFEQVVLTIETLLAAPALEN